MSDVAEREASRERKASKTAVLMLAYLFPPHFSGAGKQALALGKTLVQQGVGVTVFTQALDADLPSHEAIDGVSVHRNPLLGNPRLVPSSFALRAAAFLLANRRRFDILHVHGASWMMLPAIVTAKLLRKPVIVKTTRLGDDDPVTVRAKRYGAIQLRLLRLADRYIVLTPAIAERYRRLRFPESSLAAIPNGVDLARFAPPADAGARVALRAGLGLPPDRPIVSYVGLICRRKGLETLLDAWRRVVAAEPRALLLLIGPTEGTTDEFDGAFVEYLRAGIGRPDIAGSVRLVGPTDDVPGYLRVSDVFVLPSSSEGLSNALLEAMASALPAVVARIAGVEQVVVDGENALCFPPGDAVALATIIRQLLASPELRETLGRRARRLALDDFSSESIGARYVEMYRGLLSC